MAYLEIEEMTTHIYEEDMDTISHGDDAAMMGQFLADATRGIAR